MRRHKLQRRGAEGFSGPALHFESLAAAPSASLPLLVARAGSALIKNVPDLDAAHAFVSRLAASFAGKALASPHSRLPGTVEVSNIKNPKTGKPGWFKDGWLGWHTNGVFMKRPEECVALYCEIPPESGGETEICSLRKVYQDMDEGELRPLRGVQITYTPKNGSFYKFDNFEAFLKEAGIQKAKKGDQNPAPAAAERKKALIRRHPIDGALGLYFPFAFIHLDESGPLENMTLEESERFVRRLKERCLQKKYRQTIKWEKGDFLLIDQIHALHRRNSFKGARKLFRICFRWKAPAAERQKNSLFAEAPSSRPETELLKA